MKTVLPAIAALPLLLAPLAAGAEPGRGGSEAAVLLGLMEELARIERSGDREEEDRRAALALVGALVALSALQRERQEDRADPVAASPAPLPPEPSREARSLPAVPARPAWIEAGAMPPAPLSVLGDPPPPAATPSLIAPPPPMAEDLPPVTSQDLAEAFARASEEGRTGY